MFAFICKCLQYNGITKNNILRLNTNGTIDNSFVGSGTDTPNAGQAINTVALQNDGKIIIGGAFSFYNWTTRGNIARLNTNGTLDMSFDTQVGFTSDGFNGSEVTDILLLSNSKIFVSGRFHFYKNIPQRQLTRLNMNGSLDISFQPEDGIFAGSHAIEGANGKIITNRTFSHSGIDRLNEDGSFDVTFNPNTGSNNELAAVSALPNGKIFIAGTQMGKYNGTLVHSIAKLNIDGSIDTSFDFKYRNLASSPTSSVSLFRDIYTLAAQPDGKLLVGSGNISWASTARSALYRLQADGNLDASFSPEGDFAQGVDRVNKIVLQNDGKILVAYTAGSYNNMTYKMVRLNSNGSVDSSFPLITTDDVIHDMLLDQNGSVIIAGAFSTMNGTNADKLVRILPNGSIDGTFNLNSNVLFVSTLRLHNNQLFIIGETGVTTNDRSAFLGKITSTGNIDTNFEQAIFTTYSPVGLTYNIVQDMSIAADGKIIVVGRFSYTNGQNRSYITRVNADGTLDPFFTGGANRNINQIAKQGNDIIIVGRFTSHSGVGKNRIARIKATNVPILDLLQNQYSACINSTVTLQAQGQGTIYWYDSLTATVPIHAGNSFTTPSITATSTTYYAQDSVVGCGTSNRAALTITATQTLSAVSKPNYIAYLDNTGQGEIDATLLDSISTAACGSNIVSYLFDDTGLATRSFSCADTNTVHNVVLRVTDNNGNTDTSSTVIHVKDTISPVATTRLLPIFFNYTNQATIFARDFITSLSDNCTDSVDINVVFHDTGVDSLQLYCGSGSITDFDLRITDQAGNQVIQPVVINPSSTNYDFNVNIIGGTFRPTLPTIITVVANNYSCAPKLGELKVTLPTNVTYNSASITPNRIVGNNLFWNVTDLNYDRNFVVRIAVTPDFSLNIGDEVCFSGHITPETTDFYRLNNLKSYCFPVVNSYDPNDKQVYPQGICDEKFTKREVNQPLTYTIRFQNTGNAPALNVRIADSLSNLLDRSSLRIVGTSHSMTVDTTANNNVINFVFNNINLPDSTTSLELSQGYVIFEVDEIAAHTDTSRINNKSYIYFDTNPPIITNTVKNTILDVLPQCNPTSPNPPIADCTLPTNLSTEILTSTRVKLSWTTPANTNAVNYEVLRNGQRLATIPASNLSFIDSTLTANTQYNYSIKAICGNNDATSNSVQVRTLPSTPILLSVVAACKGERGTINVQSAGAVYRVYDSETSTTPLFETNNASIETSVLNDSTTFYISVVINGQESQRLEALVPIKEVFEATIEQGSLLESCATEFTLSAQNVDGATYTWFRENVQVGTERTLTTTFEARYKVVVIKNDCSDESEFTTTRFVDAPTAIIEQGSSVSFCGSGTLNAQDTSANVTYEWILNGTNVGNGTNISVSESGTYTLKASQPSCADSVTIAVTITTAPTNVELTAEKTAICTSEETLLSATTGTGFTYKWFRNNTAISNSSASFSTSEIGMYKVEITTAEGCQVMTNEIEITRLQVNSAILRINTENGEDKTIDVTSQDAIDSVLWFKDGVEIPSFANQNLITPTETGNYKARVIYSTGCSFETEAKTFTVDGITGIEEESAKIFTIYPNPNNGSFKVEFATTTNQKTTLTLVDGLGRIIHSQEIAMNEKTLSITLPKISAGVYVVQIISEGKVYTKQLIIQ